MKKLMFAATLAASACATPPVEIQTRDVVVTRTERAITEQDVRDAAPPAAIGARPPSLSAALDLMTAQMCEWVRYALRADELLLHAAGIPPERRVREPICEARR